MRPILRIPDRFPETGKTLHEAYRVADCSRSVNFPWQHFSDDEREKDNRDLNLDGSNRLYPAPEEHRSTEAVYTMQHLAPLAANAVELLVDNCNSALARRSPVDHPWEIVIWKNFQTVLKVEIKQESDAHQSRTEQVPNAAQS